jgi:aldehyde:ferredoxin oxidoreductase
VLGLSRFYGYVGRVLRVNLTTREVRVLELEKGLARAYLGGRGLNIVRLYYEVPPSTNPLSPENKLFFGVGPIVGTGFPLGARLNVSAKSPQTGILGDSNVGGHFAPELKYAGFDQVVIEGRSDRPIYLYIQNGVVEFRDASGLWGMKVKEAFEAIRREVGDHRVQIAVVGPAAENLVVFSGIFFNRSRPAARTGLGTVMASKGLKAVVVRGGWVCRGCETRTLREDC